MSLLVLRLRDAGNGELVQCLRRVESLKPSGSTCVILYLQQFRLLAM